MVIGSTRAIGIELELSNFGSWQVRERDTGFIDNCGYTIAHDGSVRPSALEAVFTPMAGDQQIINGLNSIANHVYVNECEVNETCGLHVHVDARDYTWADIQKLLKFWLEAEAKNTIWQLAGRNSNRFCRPWSSIWPPISHRFEPRAVPVDLADFRKLVMASMYDVNFSSINNTIFSYRGYKTQRYILDNVNDLRRLVELKANRGWNGAVAARYLNLNIHSWLYRGTIEYRLGVGTVDVDRIRMWPIFCLWLTEAINKTSLSCITKYYTNPTCDNVYKIINDGGIIVSTFQGECLYPMPTFLRNWCGQVLYNIYGTKLAPLNNTVKTINYRKL